MHDIRPAIETLISAMPHKLGNGVDLNFQYDSRIKVPSKNTDRWKSAPSLFWLILVEHGKQLDFWYIYELKDP